VRVWFGIESYYYSISAAMLEQTVGVVETYFEGTPPKTYPTWKRTTAR
jgi:hypothetical protein